MDITLAADERLFDINDSVRLIQRQGTLAFGTDAYLLSAFLRPMPRARALELGCGNGVISLLAATRGRFSHIDAVEIQPHVAGFLTLTPWKSKRKWQRYPCATSH